MQTKWKIVAYPKGNTEIDQNFLSLFLSNESKADVNAKYRFSLLDADETFQHTRNFSIRLLTKSENTWGDRQYLDLGTLKNQAEKLLPDGNLTILCDVTVVGPKKTVSIPITNTRANQNDHVIKDLSCAFLQEEFSDIKLLCGDKVFNCHQFMLAARSPVFRAMFMADMAEKKTKKVDIKDLHPEVLLVLLTFIYTGEIPEFDEDVKDILAAADQYQLDQLKSACVDHLCRNLEIKNCIDHLIMGDLYQADVLKKTSLLFIASNMKNVLKTNDWKESLQEYPSLLVEALDAFAGNKKEDDRMDTQN